jgi:succinate dehydrogenase / fumarate reductase cytochrome b subunit
VSAAPAVPRAGGTARAIAGARAFWHSTIGKKVVMAVTGIMMIGFIIAHVSGNLLVFRGAQHMNDYSAFLKGLGGLLWAMRLALLVAVILHVVAAVQLTTRSRAARPVDYRGRQPQVSTLAARTIRWGGVVLALFIVLHLLHFTTGTLRPAGYFSHTDVYGNVIASFRLWWVSALYLVAMVALGLHLFHGAWSSVRTLGIARPSADPRHRRIATALALLVFLGFSIIPVAVLAGWVR